MINYYYYCYYSLVPLFFRTRGKKGTEWENAFRYSCLSYLLGEFCLQLLLMEFQTKWKFTC